MAGHFYGVGSSGGAKFNDLPIGALVYLTNNNQVIQHRVVHKGKPSALYDDSFNGTVTLLREDIDLRHRWGATQTANIYQNSEIHAYLNGEYLQQYREDIRKAIKQVKIPHRASNGTIASGANGLLTFCYLPSMVELGFNFTGLIADGTRLSYYSDTASSGDDPKRGFEPNVIYGYWSRTPVTTGASTSKVVWVVGNYGRQYETYSSQTLMVRPIIAVDGNATIPAAWSVL